MGSPALRIAGNTAQPPVSMLPWTFALHTNSREAEKRIRQTRVLLRIFVCFDIFILIGGILNLVWITPTSENLMDMQHTFVYCTVAFFSLTLICNRLVNHLAIVILSQDRFCTVLQTSAYGYSSIWLNLNKVTFEIIHSMFFVVISFLTIIPDFSLAIHGISKQKRLLLL